MRPGGRLDGFPLHLLAGGPEAGVTLVLAGADLGRLQLCPVPGGRRTLVAAGRDRRALEQVRARGGDFGAGPVHPVLADPARLPFRRGSIDGVVAGPAGLPPGSDVLSERGWLARLLPPADWRAEAARARGEAPPQERYYVRPAAGPEYFVTQAWVPSPWPFGSLQLGRARRLALGAARLLARLPLPGLRDAVQIAVASPTAGPARLALHAPGAAGGFALFVKVGWNALLLRRGPAPSIVKYPLSAVAASRMASHAETLERLAEGALGPLDDYLPRLIEHGSQAGQDYWTEATCSGSPSSRWRPRLRWRRRVAEAGCEFLLALHRQTATPVRVSRDLFDRFTKPPLAALAREGRRLDPRFDPSALAEALWSRLADRALPLVRSHGDFWAGNVLVSREGRLTGVLDWDASVEPGWPLLDLLHLLAFRHKRRAFWHFGRVVLRRLLPGRLARWERALVETYCRSLGIDAGLWPSFVALYWLERSSQWLMTDFHEGRRNAAWLRRNVLEACPGLLEALARAAA